MISFLCKYFTFMKIHTAHTASDLGLLFQIFVAQKFPKAPRQNSQTKSLCIATLQTCMVDEMYLSHCSQCLRTKVSRYIALSFFLWPCAVSVECCSGLEPLTSMKTVSSCGVKLQEVLSGLEKRLKHWTYTRALLWLFSHSFIHSFIHYYFQLGV